MATLNVQPVQNGDEDDAQGASGQNLELSWHWHSWPSQLRKAAAIGLASLVFLLAFLWFLDSQDKDLTQKLDATIRLKASAANKLQDSGKERNIIVKQLPTLRELEKLGIFGEEKRLEWVEQLRAIEKRWPGISIKYDIAVQQLLPNQGPTGTPIPIAPIAPSSTLPNGDPVKQFGVFSTDMKLTLQLIHEGDILAIFDDLKAANLGLFTVKKCVFKRTASPAGIETVVDMNRPVLTDCTLNWTSMTAY